MSGFLEKWRSSKPSSTGLRATKAKLQPAHAAQWRDDDDPRILYKLSTRAQRISLRVNMSDREVMVIVPGERAIKKAKDFARQQADWINVQLESLPPPQPFHPGSEILVRGEPYTLIHPTGSGRPRINHTLREIYVPAPEGAFAGRVRRLLIREAREELEAATHHYAAILDRRVGKISVRDTSSRWGSCITRKGEGIINYSWRLIAAPPFVLDYVAAHECAHLVHADHSANFWRVCEEINDDVKRAKAWLRKNGPLLHAVGAEF